MILLKSSGFKNEHLLKTAGYMNEHAEGRKAREGQIGRLQKEGESKVKKEEERREEGREIEK